MTESVTPSQLRADVYHLLDRVLETGEPLEIRRKGRTLRLVPDVPTDRLQRIRTNPDVIAGDPEDLIAISWAEEWDADQALRP